MPPGDERSVADLYRELYRHQQRAQAVKTLVTLGVVALGIELMMGLAPFMTPKWFFYGMIGLGVCAVGIVGALATLLSTFLF